MRRVFLAVTVVTGLVVPAAIIGLTVAPSSAASGVQCASLKGKATGSVTISKCTPTEKTNKKLTGSAVNLETGGTLTWSPSKQTTIVGQPNTTVVTPSVCPKKDTEYSATATITGGTSTYTQVGDQLNALLCQKGSSVTLLKGTVATL